MTRGLLLAAVVLLNGSCEPGSTCTLVGCQDGLFVTVVGPTGEKVTDFEVEAVVDGTSVRFSCPRAGPNDDVNGVGWDCGPYPMGGRLLVDGFSLSKHPEPSRVTLRVTAAGVGSFDSAVTLKFEDRFPNGRECGAACRNQQLEAVLR